MNWLLTLAVVSQLIIQGPPRFPLVSSSTLNTSLVAYWKLEETSGSRADSYGSNTLTDNNTVTSNPGIISTAAQLTAVNTEYLSIADNTDLSTGNIDFTFAAWVYLDSKPSSAGIMSKYSSSGGQREYSLYYSGGGTDRFIWLISYDGTNVNSVNANNYGSPATSTWIFIVVYHDEAANQIGISVNNGTFNTAAANAAGPFDSTTAYQIGTVFATSLYWDGRIDEVGFWKKKLSASEITELYNSGAGKTCCPF